MAATAPLDPRLARVDGRLCWRLGDRIVPLIAGGDDGDPPPAPDGGQENTKDTQTGDEPTGTTTADSDLPEGVREVMRKERAAARKAAKERDELAARLKDIEDRDKTETERNREAAETAARERDEARAQLMRERVARRLQVPDGLVDRLRGDTEEALEDDARSLLGAMTAREPDPKRPAGPTVRDGATPTPDGIDAQIAAAEKAGDWASAIALKARKSATLKE
jgi:hypothetical protein